MIFWIFINILGISLFTLTSGDLFIAFIGMLTLDMMPFLTALFYHYLYNKVFNNVDEFTQNEKIY